MNEEALLARASEERERIFQRYERGRDNLAGQIDPWEDPEFEDYHKTDRYLYVFLGIFRVACFVCKYII